MHALSRRAATFGTLLFAAIFWPVSASADYRLERVASGLSQPTYVTQAPGDTNFIYVLERANVSNGSKLGRVLKYDLNTRTHTTVLDFGTQNINGDAALTTMAFSPDFLTDNKFYLAWNTGTSGQLGTSRVQEYTIGGGGTASLTRTILEYQSNSTGNNHTVDWIGFNPLATGGERYYLYITTGDGGPFQANLPSYVNKAQDLNQIYGKMLRVDISGGDDYPGSSTKNFAIPATNPIPAGGGAGLGEIWASGFRNPWRASFDRANGDLYIGDVGWDQREEIDFIKDGSIVAGTPPDYGWAKREGTIQTPATVGGPQGASLNPIVERTHATDQSITGGYVYHGPITELQGKYVFGDHQSANIYTMELGTGAGQFDRDTPTASYNGANGTLTDVTSLFESLVVDPTDPGYVPGPSFGANFVTSFGEDNFGHLYIIDIAGEIFRLTPFLAGDFDDDNDADADDIDILWSIVRATGSDPFNNDSADLNGDTFANEDDVDYMLANLLTAGPNRQYGDADLDGGVGGLDYTAWRLRVGTGWTHGDFDGDGGVGGLDYTLWRTRPTQYPGTVGPHSGSGDPQIVPEPASLILLGLALPALLAGARRRLHQ